MANARTHPEEWREVRVLSSIENLNEEGMMRLEELKQIFATKKTVNTTKKKYRKPKLKVIMYDADGVKYLYNTVEELCEVENLNARWVKQLAREGRTLLKGQLKGCRFVYKEEAE